MKKFLKRSVFLSIIPWLLLVGCSDSKKADYDEAVELQNTGDYDAALKIFKTLGSYEDSEDRIQDIEEMEQKKADYKKAVQLQEEEKYGEAIEAFQVLGDYEDSQDRLENCQTLKEEEDSSIERGEALTQSDLTGCGPFEDIEVIVKGPERSGLTDKSYVRIAHKQFLSAVNNLSIPDEDKQNIEDIINYYFSLNNPEYSTKYQYGNLMINLLNVGSGAENEPLRKMTITEIE